MYYTGVYYAGNDYRNYVSHSWLGTTWKKATAFIDKIPKPGGGFRYIYDTAKTNVGNAIGRARTGASNFVDRHITGSSYRKEMLRNSGYGNKGYNRATRSRMQAKYNNARSAYNKTLRGRAEAVGRRINSLTRAGLRNARDLVRRGRGALSRAASKIGGLARRAGGAIGSLINKGRSFLSYVAGAPARKAANKKLATGKTRQNAADRGDDIKGGNNSAKETERRMNQYRSANMQRQINSRRPGTMATGGVITPMEAERRRLKKSRNAPRANRSTTSFR